MRVLDISCGGGGPQRSIASKFGCEIVGLNINEYQLGKCAEHSRRAGLDDLCGVPHGDIMAIPADDGSLDAAYHTEAIPHGPTRPPSMPKYSGCCSRGGAGYDWCVTPRFDGGSPQHRELKERIEYSNAAPELATFTDVTKGLQAAGFEHIEARDRAPDSGPGTPWYRPLEGNGLRGLPRTALAGEAPRRHCAYWRGCVWRPRGP